ncbi:TPA: restriction endonuclease [Pseudomonas aeruginosa]|uniref:restriction endonuclease n=1 Tax=Pseudomonas aeruginosa TaxID=287 RepID=UPI0009A26ABC|nr:restriction endonuclease [Pseudomonas aeruginosa]HBN8545355.1 restriction endonuclease [Pseudomonas aeruginosa]
MTSSSKERPVIDVTNISLEQWLSMVFTHAKKRKHRFIDFRFPTDTHATEYLATAERRSDLETKDLIRSFLIPPGVQGHDHRFFHNWIDSGDIIQVVRNNEYARRLFRNEGWEGLTWILDLLPDWPQQAVDTLDAFIRAHTVYLSDDRMLGLFDAISIIRHKYLLSSSPREILNNISSRDFEFLIAALFRKQKLHPKVTKQSRDGGADVVCNSYGTPIKQKILIECKHHTGTVGVDVIRKLAGVVSETGATSGWVITSSKFSSPAVGFASTTGRIQLLDYQALNLKFNEYFGARWTERLPSIISREQQNQIKNIQRIETI